MGRVMAPESERVLVFLDTEFTHFVDHLCELMSLGLVDYSGERELYLELSEWDRGKASAFVREVVCPLLGRDQENICTRPAAAARISDWFAALSGPADVLSDSGRDLKLLQDLLGPMPSSIRFRLVPDQILGLVEDAIDEEFRQSRQERHHALVDARALRGAYLKVLRNIGPGAELP